MVEINAQGKASPSAGGLRDYESGNLGFAAVGGCLPYALVSGKPAPNGAVAVTLSV